MTTEPPTLPDILPDLPPQSSRGHGLPSIDPRDAPALALLGHDLRAGLSEVIGSLRLIAPEGLTPPARQQVNRSLAASEALTLLLEQALTLLSDGDPTSAPHALQTDRLLANLKLRWTPRLRTLGLQFQLLAAPDLPAQLGLDGALFERVLANLLGNTAKYVRQGRVICRVGLLHDRMLQVSLQDDGPGFSPSSLARISSGRSGRDAPSQPGSGLGLLIVREMVEASGGALDIRNRDSGGALVLVSLPLTNLPQTDPDTAPTEAAPDLSHLRILLADDSPTHRALHQQLLSRMGAEVVLARDGVETIGRIERESFDLVLIDVEMPYFNGLDVIRHIRGMSTAMAKLPILALTAHSSDAALARIADVGADGLLTKPVASAKVLGQAVLRVHQQKPSRKLSAPLQPPRAPDGIDTAQFANLLKMAGPQGAAKILTHIHLDLLRTEADLIAASHGPNWAALRAHTHVLIALAGTAGADGLSQQAQALNQLAHQIRPDRSTFLARLPQLLESLRELLNFITMKIQEQGASHK
jgi:two-component system, OmpR family, aerobic respiration control sensor histidine kinase ArcB